MKDNYGEEYAGRILSGYIREIDSIADHPSKGMFVDRRRKIKRWPLDRHNYVTYIITEDGILIHNILAYKLNKRGF